MIAGVAMRPFLLLAPLVLATAPRTQDQQPPIDFAREVRPLLMERCVRCHGPRRSEADLRLDRKALLFAGDPELWVVVPGKPDDSLALELVSLPADDVDHMPEEGRSLSPAELELFRRWIAEGATWPDAIDAAADARATRRHARETLEVPDLEDEALAAEQRAIARLVEFGARANRIAASTAALDVDLSPVAARFGDAELPALDGLEPRLCWLRLRGTKLTDRGAATLAHFRALRRLDLSDTAITDAALPALERLPELRVLDLHHTPVGDDAVSALAAMPKLTAVHLWHTHITDAGATRLRALRPDLRIDLGHGAERLREPPPAPPAPPPEADDADETPAR